MRVNVQFLRRVLLMLLIPATLSGGEPTAHAVSSDAAQVVLDHPAFADTGIRAVQLGGTPVPITNVTLKPESASRGVRITSVTVENPRLEEIVAIGLWWALCDESASDEPVVTGTTVSQSLAQPLRIRDKGAVTVDLVITAPNADATYQLHVSVDSIAYRNGQAWHRSADNGKENP